jgi:membrane protein DedA with SNARE-associated domain
VIGDDLGSAVLMTGIVLGSLVSEDAATATAASFAATGTLDPSLAFVSAFAGVWLGDVALYGIARRFRNAAGESRWIRSLTAKSSVRMVSIVRQWGATALLASRFLPGTRLPATLAAGATGMSAPAFLSTTALGALVWITFNFVLVGRALRTGRISLVLAGTLVTLLAGTVLRRVNWAAVFRQSRTIVRRWSRWEFWPAWLFYAPVVGMCAWLALRYRGLMLPALANPSQRNGGVIGESKSEILAALEHAAPEFVAPTVLICEGTPEQRIGQILNAVRDARLTFPFILKPNVGQRGAGFKKINSMAEAEGYLRQVTAPVVAQAYVPGPYEAGIFYYRFPGEARGHILAITDKAFPVVCGDGRSTVAQLIERDQRASLIAPTYLKRLGTTAQHMPAEGECISLVQAGNHCQGCIFRDGAHLWSEALLERIDAISHNVPGFYIGRFDVRYSSTDEFRAGTSFTIIELNGAASEATSIYDSRNSLLVAYRMLYRQWQLVYAIGAANRRRGFRTPVLRAMIADWLAYQRQSAEYPLAD